MKVRMLSFASLREGLKRPSGEMDVPEGATPRTLLAQLLGPERAALADSVAFAVNLEYVSGDQPLREGDEVAFLPPVSGG